MCYNTIGQILDGTTEEVRVVIEIKTGSWVRINEHRMFLLTVNDRSAAGLVFDRNRTGVYTRKEIPLQDIRDAARSRRPAGTVRHLVPEGSITFGRIRWDEDNKKVHSVQFILNDKLQTVHISERVPAMV